MTKSKDLLSTIFNTAEFKQYSRDCRDEVVERIGEKPFERLLDLDCGTGLLLEQIYSKYPDVKASGFDYSLERLSRARERLGKYGTELAFGQAVQLPYPDNTFDVVVSTTTFHHYHQPAKVLSEVFRVLKKGGRFIVADTYLNASLRYLNKLARPLNEVTDMVLYSKKDIWRLLNATGFTGIKWRLLNDYAYLVEAQSARMPLIEEI